MSAHQLPRQFSGLGVCSCDNWDRFLQDLCWRGELDRALQVLFHVRTPLSVKTYISLLRVCCKNRDLCVAIHVHSHITIHNIAVSGCLGHHLVITLAKCGAVDQAYQISATLSHRNAFTWNAIISAYMSRGQEYLALQSYESMIDDGVDPTDFTYVCLFKACANIRSLEHGKKLHIEARGKDFCSRAHVGCSLLNMYGKCGAIVDAEDVFCALPQRDTVTWNAMLSAYVTQNEPYKALQLYRQMRKESCEPNHLTFVILIQACGSIADNQVAVIKEISGRSFGLEIGQALHVDAYRNSGCMFNDHVGNSLVTMYGKCGEIVEALLVFSILHQWSIISWNSILSAHLGQGYYQECLQLYKYMQEEGVSADQLTLSIALQACGLLVGNKDAFLMNSKSMKVMCLEIIQALHMDACLKEYEKDVFVGTALLSAYGKLGSITEAEDVFISLLSSQDVVAWTAMLSAYIEQKQGEKALQLYTQMEVNEISPNQLTCIIILQACNILAEKDEAHEVNGRLMKTMLLEIGQALHTDACLRGFLSNMLVVTSILNMYGKCGTISEAENVFASSVCRDTISWNAMLSMYCKHGQGEQALDLFVEMQKQNVAFDHNTLVCVMQACSIKGILESCEKHHFCIISAGYDKLPSLEAALIHAYGISGSVADAQHCFDGLARPDAVSWAVFISACSHHERSAPTMDNILAEMVLMNQIIDDVVVASILTCCSHSGLVRDGINHFVFMNQRYGLKSNFKHIGIMIDLYGRAGDFKRITSILSGLNTEVDITVWVSFLGACYVHNDVEMAEQVYAHVTSLQPTDDRAYVLMSNVYANVGS